MKRNRAVITGIGIVAPNGIGIEAFWESILIGRSGIGPITSFDASDFESQIAGEIKDFNPLDYMEPDLKPMRMARHTQLAYAATMLALKDANLDINNLELPSPTPVVIGVSMNSMDVLERALDAVRDHGPGRAPATACAASLPQGAANVIADRLGACAHADTISSACPSGLDAIAQAAQMIRNGQVDLAIAGGTDAPITPLAMACFTSSGLSSRRNADPAKADRPFDRARDSGVISEGAGVFVLENMERAEARGVRAYLEISGYGKHRDVDPAKPASGLEFSMKSALANARRTLAEVDCISAYGPGHPLLDAVEVEMIKQVFGARAHLIPVTSIKGVTGNALAAGGPFQVAASALTIRDQLIAPTANYEAEDPKCDLDFVPNKPRKSKVDCVLINVRGLGGSASTMVVDRVPRQ